VLSMITYNSLNFRSMEIIILFVIGIH